MTRIIKDCPICKMKVNTDHLFIQEFVFIDVNLGLPYRSRAFYFHIKCFKEQLEKCESFQTLKKTLFEEKQKQPPIESSQPEPIESSQPEPIESSYPEYTIEEIEKLMKELGIEQPST